MVSEDGSQKWWVAKFCHVKRRLLEGRGLLHKIRLFSSANDLQSIMSQDIHVWVLVMNQSYDFIDIR
jgi:hypothetical protein